MRRIAIVVLSVLLSACTSTTPSQPAAAPAATPSVPSAQPAHHRSANALTPVASMARTIQEPKIRVGLLTDQPAATFPRIPDGYYVVTDAGASVIRRGFTVTAPLSGATVRYAVQVSSISDHRSAQALLTKVRTETGLPVVDVFDSASGSYRILVGDFADADAAGPTRSQLTERGYGTNMLVVRRPSTEPFEKRHALVDDEGDRHTFEGDSILIVPVTADTLQINDLPYRTGARLFINTRGLYNVVNELNLEDYLFGVVPAEMGPKIFDELEALKAQAVAARTYAVRNLGQFKAEGYDICPGPACQAYKGFSGEDPLSNQAVTETAGLVMTHQGKMIDALYTSTCGGETSDVGTMFPSRSDPYLKAVRCVELDMVTLAGRADSGLLTEQQVNGRLFAALAGLGEGTSWGATDVEKAVVAATRLVGAPAVTAARPASSRRGDVLRYLAEVFRADQKARKLVLPEDRKYYFPQSANPEEQAFLAASFFIKFGMMPTQFIDRVSLDQPMPREELYALLGSWLREMALVQEVTGKIFKLEGRALTLKGEGKITPFTLPAGIPIFRRLGDRLQEYREVPVMIGDRAIVLQSPKKVPVAMVVQANFDGASFDRTSSYANWTRSWRADELVPVINRRNAIQQLLDIRPVSIDDSERVRELEVTAEGGRKFTLKGLPVRWSLNVPDNLFEYDKTKDPDGVDRYTFYGKGWGHGTGFCQVGSYGMAFRGYKFDQILKHYYTDVEVVPSSQASK